MDLPVPHWDNFHHVTFQSINQQAIDNRQSNLKSRKKFSF